MFYSPTVLPAGATGSRQGDIALQGGQGMTRLLLASVSTMLLTTIAGPVWSQAPAPPAAPSAQPAAPAAPPAQPSRPPIETKKVTDKPIRYRIYSHHHFDHIAGGKAFKDAGATVIAHKRVKERLAPLGDPNTVLPDEVFDDKKTIELGGTTLELSYHGLNHSDSTIVMRLPREKIVFIVDTIPVGSVPGRGMIDMYPLETEDFIKKVLAMDWERLIPGHPGQPNGRLGTKKDAEDQLKLLQEASAEMKKLGQEGKCWDTAEKEFKLPNYASWPGYENGLPFIARRYCGLWGRGT